MQAKPVVIAIYEFRQLLMQGFEATVSSRIDLFTLWLASGAVIPSVERTKYLLRLVQRREELLQGSAVFDRLDEE